MKQKVYEDSMGLIDNVLGLVERETIHSQNNNELVRIAHQLDDNLLENEQDLIEFDEFGLSLASIHYVLDLFRPRGDFRDKRHVGVWQRYFDLHKTHPDCFAVKLYITLEEPYAYSLKKILSSRNNLTEVKDVKLKFFDPHQDRPAEFANRSLLLGTHAIVVHNDGEVGVVNEDSIQVILPPNDGMKMPPKH